ncbi:MAG: 50S ribosomal protein L21 [Deltaproteobacteria bacterium]|nr:MAG: 50S ribosomal protein L21 [Deltaproteobacteria bacterium]
MYAVIETKGRQYRVAEGDSIQVDHVDAEVGSTIELDRVLMVGGDDPKVGAPVVEGATVTAEVVSHELGDKREVFKYKRRKRYRRNRGFRPSYTTLRIQTISA